MRRVRLREAHPYYRGVGEVVAISHAGDTSNGHDGGSTAAYLDAWAVGFRFQPWPVNDREEMERLLELGVTGLITAEHQLLRDVLVEREAWCHG